MGILRLLLALSVVLFHLGSTGVFVPGPVAVEVFFIISGFYMALILDGRYGDAWSFYANRALRIFPAYWLVAGATVLAYAFLNPDAFAPILILPLARRLALAASTVTLVGQDAANFLADTDGRIALVGLAGVEYQSATTVARDFPIPQAWSLSVELLFYAIVPLLVRQGNAALVALGLGSIGMRAAAYAAGLQGEPWATHLFPLELALFLSGVGAYRFYRARQRLVCQILDRLGALPLALACAALLAFGGLPDVAVWKFSAKTAAFYAALSVALPFIFAATKDLAPDRWIGQLSYPLYLCHIIVIEFVRPMDLPPPLHRLAVILVSLIVAILLALAVERPIERLRARRGRPPISVPVLRRAPPHTWC